MELDCRRRCASHPTGHASERGHLIRRPLVAVADTAFSARLQTLKGVREKAEVPLRSCSSAQYAPSRGAVVRLGTDLGL